jgi:hypothetical protein
MSFKKVDGFKTILESTVEKGVFLYDLSTEEGREEADRHYAESVICGRAWALHAQTLSILEELWAGG